MWRIPAQAFREAFSKAVWIRVHWILTHDSATRLCWSISFDVDVRVWWPIRRDCCIGFHILYLRRSCLDVLCHVAAAWQQHLSDWSSFPFVYIRVRSCLGFSYVCFIHSVLFWPVQLAKPYHYSAFAAPHCRSSGPPYRRGIGVLYWQETEA